MFIGHYGLALATKKYKPSISLGTTIMATQFVDLLWSVFILTGVEKVSIEPGITEFNALNFTHYPYTHSLVAGVVWGVLFAIVYYLITRNRNGAIISGILVLSHWILDVITHRPDLPLGFGESTKVGFGLWHSRSLTLAVEAIIYIVGASLYLSATKPKNKLGSILIWAFLLIMAALYVASAFGPVPASVEAIGQGALIGWLIVLWGYWIDKNRTAKTT